MAKPREITGNRWKTIGIHMENQRETQRQNENHGATHGKTAGATKEKPMENQRKTIGKNIGNPTGNKRNKPCHPGKQRKTTGNNRKTNGKPWEDKWKTNMENQGNHRKTLGATVGKTTINN